MRKLMLAVLGVAVFALGVSADSSPSGPVPATHATTARHAQDATAPKMAVSHESTAPDRSTAEGQTALVKQYCVVCHNDKSKRGNLSLERFDVAHAAENAETAELMIHKLMAGMMPPLGAKRPAPDALHTLMTSLETRVDRSASLHPNPGSRVFQRLNRAEYGRAIHDLFGIDVDVDAYLPADTMSAGFDNIADTQSFSATLMEGYLNAATKIAKLAVGDPKATPGEVTYNVPRTESQMRHIDGTPWGTRGGTAVTHIFPADGDYTFRLLLHGVPTGELYGSTVKGEKVEVSIDGARVALLDIDPKMTEAQKNGLNLTTPRIHVKAGPHEVAAAFLQHMDGPVDDLIAPIEYTLADTQIGDGYGITTLPHLRDLAITGPFSVTGVSDTISRERIFTCRPTSADEETTCASQILKRFATQAYREPATENEVNDLLNFYKQGRKDGDFENGIRIALQALLVSPRFLFRLEDAPATLKAGQTYRINDRDLATRLSYFLWDDAPDAELLKYAIAGTLHTPAILDKQVRRMLKDPRAESLSTRFASEWFRLQDVDKIRPDALLFPSYDYRLADSYKRETQLLFNSIVQENRDVLDLLTADYTFVNERIARQYGIPNVTGDQFRRVTLPPEMDYRRGLLGQGSILMLTSVADRTSPVQRGKWIMEVLLDSPPPPPPPNVPALDATPAAAGGKPLSVRERMEEHRKNPFCASCHKVIDPLGLALDSFDVTGAYRIKDNEVPVDTSGTLYDGSTIDGPKGLREALLKHSDLFLTTFTKNLMTYALGRRVEYYDMPTIRAIDKKAAQTGNHFSSFVLGIVSSPAFQMSRVEPAVMTTADAQTGAAGPAKGSRR